jgi:hypothetical protein
MLDDHNTFISNETLFVPLLNMHKDLSSFFGFFGEVLSEVPNDLQFKALEDWIFNQLLVVVFTLHSLHHITFKFHILR